MPTKPDTDTGRTANWPTAEDAFYWMRYRDGRYRDLPVHVAGINVMCLFDRSYLKRGDIEGEVEFLGPISPSDFEQLLRLRRAGRDALETIQKRVNVLDLKTQRGMAIDADRVAAALNEALATTGKQS